MKKNVNQLTGPLQAASIAVLMLCCPLAAGAKPYKAAEIYTQEDWLYGKFVFSMRAAKGSGVISNFFLWKNDSELPGVDWEEVDIEVFGKDNAETWQSNIITEPGGFRLTSEEVHTEVFSMGDIFHTFTVEWSPGAVSWYVDGVLARSTFAGQADDLDSPAQARFNFWPPDAPAWVGPWDDDILPLYMYVDWVEYYAWDDANDEFAAVAAWRDDFNTFDTGRWARADWTFTENRADFVPQNAYVSNGNLVLRITLEVTENDDDYSGDSGSSGGSSGGGGCLIFVMGSFLYFLLSPRRKGARTFKSISHKGTKARRHKEYEWNKN